MDRRHFLQIGAATVIAPFPSFPIEAAPAIEPLPETITMTIGGLVRDDQVAVGVTNDGFMEDVLFNEAFRPSDDVSYLNVAIPKEYDGKVLTVRVRHDWYVFMEANVAACNWAFITFIRMRDF